MILDLFSLFSWPHISQWFLKCPCPFHDDGSWFREQNLNVTIRTWYFPTPNAIFPGMVPTTNAQNHRSGSAEAAYHPGRDGTTFHTEVSQVMEVAQIIPVSRP